MPVSPGAIISRVFEIYGQQAVVLLPTAAGLFAIQFVIALLVPGAITAIASILFFVLSTLYQGMVVELVRDVQDGRRDHSVGGLIRSVEPVLWPLLLVSIIAAVCIAIGFVLIIVPGLILLTIWAVVAPVVVLEQPGVLATFGRSRELVRGNAWRVFAVIVLLYLLTAVVSSIVSGVASGLGHVGRDLVQWGVSVALAPLSALTASVLFFALRGAHGEATSPDLGRSGML